VNDPAGESAGMTISPGDPTSVLFADGRVVPVYAPIVELFVMGPYRCARTRMPGAARDVVRCINRSGLPGWQQATIKPETAIAIEGDTLRAAGFEHAFRGLIFDLVEFDDGAFAVAWCSKRETHTWGANTRLLEGITVVDAGGRERWSKDATESGIPVDMWELRRIDDPLIPDALVAAGTMAYILHPWDGHVVLSWLEK